MGGRQSSQGGGNGGSTTVATRQATVSVEENREDRNSTGTNASRDSSNVDVSRTDQPHGERRLEASYHSLRVVGRSSRPSSSYAEGARSVRERVRILPNPTTYSSSAPATNAPLDISLLLGFRDAAITSKPACITSLCVCTWYCTCVSEILYYV